MAALQRRRLLRCQRDGEVERRTVTDSALDPDLAAMHLDDLLNDREAQAGPGYRLGGAAADPPEAFEDMLDLVRRDAQPGVGDADERKTAVGAGRQRHRPAIGRVLDRIVDEVAQDLDETVAVFVRSSFSSVALAPRCESSASASRSWVSRTVVTSSTITSTCSGRPLASGMEVAVICSHSQRPPPVAARTWTLRWSVMPARSGASRARPAA